jgi:hypothetical protein
VADARLAIDDDLFWLPYRREPAGFDIKGSPLYLQVVPHPETTIHETVLVSSVADRDVVELFAGETSYGWLAVELVSDPGWPSLSVALFETPPEALAAHVHALRVSKEPGIYRAYALDKSRKILVSFAVEVVEPAEELGPRAADKPKGGGTEQRVLAALGGLDGHGITLIEDLEAIDVDGLDIDEPVRSQLNLMRDRIASLREAPPSPASPAPRKSASERLGVHIVTSARPTDPKAGR